MAISEERTGASVHQDPAGDVRAAEQPANFGRIDPRALRLFGVICEAGSISGAARILNLSQPSLSNAIGAFEARLGTRLFERSRTGIVLTAEGKALRVRALMLSHLLRDAEAEVNAVKTGIVGPIRVGGTPGALVSLLPRAIDALERQGTRVALNVIERSEAELHELLRSGDIELAFVSTEIEAPPADLCETTYSRDPFYLVVGRANDSLPETISLREAKSLRWVLPEAQGAFRRQVDALFVVSEIPMPADIIRCDSLLTTKAIVRGGERVTILPKQVASSELSIGVLRAIAIEEARFTRSVGVRRLKDTTLSPLALEITRLLECL